MKNARFLFVLGFLLSASFLAAQEFTGRVTDSTGAVLPKATVVAHNLGTSVDTSTVSTASGNYTIPYLKPGDYVVSAQATGFEKGLHTGINLQVGQTSTVNFSLGIGRATETITVEGDTLVDFGKADVGEVVENTRVTELPLNGRDPGMLSILSAAALWTGSPQYQRPFDDTQENLSINGGGAGNTALMLDGINNTASGINNTGQAKIAYVVPVDSVQEFKIITNPYDAQYGLMAGGVENVISKSGTNAIHGDVYEYARRTWLDANTWQNNYNIARAKPGADVSPFTTQAHRLDQYGAEVDGPVYIPKLYNGRNKSFFAMQYENWNEIQPNTVVDSVPDPKWLTGDFSSLVYYHNGAYLPMTLLDPMNISQNSSGTWTRVPFGPTDTINPTSGPNIIPQARINKMAQKILSYYPAPNTTPPPGSNPFANNYTVAGSDTNHYRNVPLKFDQTLSSKDRFSLHYGYWERIEVRSYDGFTGPNTRGQLPHGERSHTFTVEETHTATPNLLFDFRANVSVRADYSFAGPLYDPTALGWSKQQVTDMGPAAMAEFPYFNLSEFSQIGSTGNGETVRNGLSLFPTVTWIKKQHTFHGGLDVRLDQSAAHIIGGGNNFWVDRAWTQTNCNSCGSWDSASGNSIASLLLGNPTSGSDSIGVKTFWTSHYWAPFLQDDWKVTRKMTLNLGVRWDFVPGAVERHNQGNGAFNATGVNPISSQVSVPGYSQIVGGLTYLGTNGTPRTIYPLNWFNIQPRVGVAYAIDDKTVLRLGFGESMRTPQNGPSSFGYNASTNYQANDPAHPGSTYPNRANQIDNPYDSTVKPTGSSLGMLEYLGQGPYTVNGNYKIPSFWNYSVGVERQFMKRDTVSLAYVGTQLFNGDSSDSGFNRQSSSAYAPCNPQLGGRYEVCDNNNVPNPFKGISAFQGSGDDYNKTDLNALIFTQPFPQFGGMTAWQLNDYHTWYNSLQLTAEHKWSRSLTLHGTWNWSKLMNSGGFADSTYRVAARHLDGNDHTHRVTLSGVYMLPVGRNRSFLPNANRLVDGAIGGWELGSLYVYQTGSPWGVPDNPNEAYLRTAYVQPHIQKDNGFIRLAAPCVEQYVEDNNTHVYNLVSLNKNYDYDGTCSQGPVFQQVPRYGQTQNVIYSGIRIPRTHQFDVNLSKNFAIVERLKLQVRMEAFNVLNHPVWSLSPTGSTNDPMFGLIQKGVTGQSNLPRQIQLSAKVMW